MNGLLFWVLKEIGFSINMVNCTAWTNEKWSANFGHMGLVVDLEQKQLFVDVGWGDHRVRSWIISPKNYYHEYAK